MIQPSESYKKPDGIDYYSLPFISNSGLKGFAGASEETLEFGRQFHLAALEPHLYIPSVGHAKIVEMIKSLRKNALFNMMFNDPTKQVEQEYFPLDASGAQCKLKLDLQVGPPRRPRVISDLKTTDARTREEFQKRAIEYGYDCQGAFYLDGTGAVKFIIFAVSKHWPHPTFTYILTAAEVGEGRRKYEELMDKKLNPREVIF